MVTKRRDRPHIAAWLKNRVLARTRYGVFAEISYQNALPFAEVAFVDRVEINDACVDYIGQALRRMKAPMTLSGECTKGPVGDQPGTVGILQYVADARDGDLVEQRKVRQIDRFESRPVHGWSDDIHHDAV